MVCPPVVRTDCIHQKSRNQSFFVASIHRLTKNSGHQPIRPLKAKARLYLIKKSRKATAKALKCWFCLKRRQDILSSRYEAENPSLRFLVPEIKTYHYSISFYSLHLLPPFSQLAISSLRL